MIITQEGTEGFSNMASKRLRSKLVFSGIIVFLVAISACASKAPGEGWTLSSIEGAVDVIGFSLSRECSATRCDLKDVVRSETYSWDLDRDCASIAELCIWREGLVELFIPQGDATEWNYNGSHYILAEDDGERRYVKQLKDGKFYAGYVISRSRAYVRFVVIKDEICVEIPHGNLLCFNQYPGRYLAFDIAL